MKLRNRLFLLYASSILLLVTLLLGCGIFLLDLTIREFSRQNMEREVDKIAADIEQIWLKILHTQSSASTKTREKLLCNEILSKYAHFRWGDTGVLCLLPETEDAYFLGARSILEIHPGKNGALSFYDGITKTPMYAVSKTAGNHWKVALAITEEEFFRKRMFFLQLGLLAGATILLLSFVCAYYFIGRFTIRLDRIIDAVRRVAEGNLDTRLDMKPFSDEDAELQTGLNTMIANLKLRAIERDNAELEARKGQKLESIGILAGGIAHDFNNLLTAIHGNLQLAQMFNNNPETANSLVECEKASVRAMALTRQLLTFAKGGNPYRTPNSIAELIVNNATFMLRGSKCTCEFHFSDDLKFADIDVGQIGQAIDNIVINANQAMPSGGVIHISAENISVDPSRSGGSTPSLPLPRGTYVKITIRDEGVGISPENLEKIFDPFFSTKANGSGLGLSTAHNIIKRHGGYLTAESIPGQGSSFFIYLPVSPGNSSSGASAAAAKGAKAASSSSSLSVFLSSGEQIRSSASSPFLQKTVPRERTLTYVSGGHVLIVDDQENIRQLLGKMLGIMNCVCEYASDGAEAIEKYKHAKNSGHPFDAVFMDLTIPGKMGGKEAIAILKKLDPGVRAVVASGYSNDPVMANFHEYGFVARLDKPFKVMDINDIMEKILSPDNPLVH